jgi:membrane protein DedA with SNARE-associated domain
MILQYIATLIINVITATGYGGLFIFSALESCAIPIPSEVVVPFSGFLAAAGHFNIALVIVIATLGNWFGSIVLYSIGKTGGIWILERYGSYVFVHSEDIQRANQWFKKYGSSMVFWSRLLPVVRTFSPLAAGVGRMDLKKFNLYTLIGSGIWNFALAWIGYKTGENWDVLHKYFQKFDVVIAIVIALAIIWWIMRHIRREK